MPTYLGFPDPPLNQSAYLTIGNFDGVHRGHQALVSRMAQAAHDADCLAGLLTFDPHPLSVLRPNVPLAYLTSADERAEVLTALGLDFVLMLPFSRQVAALSAAEFMSALTGNIPLAALWIGPDFALGRGREGNAARLSEIGAQLGYRVQVVPPFDWQGQPVRSSRVRTLLGEDGDATQAAELLGRPYQAWGTVTTGAQRGRTIGFPTANLMLPAGRLVPANGVYACWAWRQARGIPAVVNVGVRPTFDNAHRSIEAFLLDFSDDLYGETMGLSFVRRLRGEQRFSGIDALVQQIEADVSSARRVLSDPPDDAGIGGQKTADGRPQTKVAFWEELEHTADWAIEVRGDSQRQLFARAAAAMYALQDADPARPITLARAVSASADNPAELLVAWLNRLLLNQEISGELYTRFAIHAISARGLLGAAYGYPGAPSHTAIKAVTYHDLDVTQRAEGWTGRITFDV
ncbi:MAG: bifunctional riboflavin kinase/FAD synthetase [Anaerolineae bacterium]|jgi:riboflavin kinase/FMN adenylyltransferase|nr:bifunctional riboflavin kinase/FAD synthetase [Anaerolineae bacterium]